MAIGLLVDAETVNPGWKDKLNAVIAWINAQTGTTIPVGGILPWFGNPNDATKFDGNGVGKDGTDMEKFALCLGQGLSGSLLKNFDGTGKSTAPDMRGKYPMGWDAAQGEVSTIGQTGGEKAVTLTAENIAPHTHVHNKVRPGGSAWVGGNSGGGLTYDIFTTEQTGVNTPSVSGTVAHNNLPPYLATGYIVRYK